MANIPDDFEELLYELSSADGLGSAICIYNDILAKKLVSIGWACRNIRGSYGGTNELSIALEDYDSAILLFKMNYDIL